MFPYYLLFFSCSSFEVGAVVSDESLELQTKLQKAAGSFDKIFVQITGVFFAKKVELNVTQI